MAFIGFSGSLSVDDGTGTPPDFEEIPEVTMVRIPSSEVELKDASFLHLPTRDRVYVAGLNTPSEVEFEANYTLATYTRLEALKGISHIWKISHADSALDLTFTAILKNATADFKVDDVVILKGKMQVSGPVTIAP